MDTLSMRQSERFAADDSDISLCSCDGTIFKVHRINLKMHSDIFADAEAISSSPDSAASESSSTSKPNREVVSLSETAEVLEVLLQYMYRQPPPELSELDFKTVSAVAEASEKYGVYFAIDSCKRAMRDVIPEHPFEVLNWAVKHKHTRLIDEAAECTIRMATDNMGDALAPAIRSAWIVYHKHWLDALNGEYSRHPPTTSHWNSVTRDVDLPCDAWTHSYALISHTLGARPELLLEPEEIFRQSEDYLKTKCAECKETLLLWRKEMAREVERIPRFSTLI
ncbi:hypothetical protein HGRIS_002325 [Hohenbuehelia grisea]|uniref:BTB domain-containing protein n=1 Tax=Hohenbuehelia grisea TaxID=104357 RepID=A0ABR3JK51_9AGAR